MQTPTQRNPREENDSIKSCDAEKTRKTVAKSKNSQKDSDARWTKKNNKAYFGYKNHVQVDVKYKFIRDSEVIFANIHDSQVFESLLDAENSSVDVWADSAYRSEKSLQSLAVLGYRVHLQRKGTRGHPLSAWEKQTSSEDIA